MTRAQFCAHLHTLAQRADHITDAEFTDCCYQAVSQHSFTPVHLRDTMDIATDSFERWMAGANLPHPLVRAKVLLAVSHFLQTP